MNTTRTNLSLESLDERIVPAVIDLTPFGASGTLNNALVHRMDTNWGDVNGSQSFGRGQLRTILTVDANGVEQGYNTTARPIQSGMNSSSNTDETRALRLDRVPVVTVNGSQYYEFVLNVNEPSGNRAISVDELRFYSASQNNLKNYNSSNFTLGPNATNNNRVSPVWDLDAGNASNALLVRAKQNTAAVGEIAVLVPVSRFNGAAGDSFVYIYTKMGGLAAARGGVEEWGVRRDPPAAPPPSGGTGSISGRVSSNAPNGDIDFQIIISGMNGEILHDADGNAVDSLTVMTNDDGSYNFGNLDAGTYQITLVKQGPRDQVDSTLGTTTDNQTPDGDASGAMFTGIVLSQGEVGSSYNFSYAFGG